MALWALTSGAGAALSKPNVILILIDDMGWGDLPSYQAERKKRGLPAMENPGFARLENEGMLLRRHYSSAPLCAPARSSLFTGVHQGHAKTVRDRLFDIPIEDAPTLGTVMQSAGYKTACIGKWGIGGGTERAGTPQQSSAYPTKRGFDYYFGYLDHQGGHHHYPKESKYPGTRNGIWDMERCVTEDCDKAYSVDLLTARAKKWIIDTQRTTSKQPFFLTLTHIAVHNKLQIPTGPYPPGRGVKGGVQWLGRPHRLVNTAEGEIDSYIDPRYADKKWPMSARRYATMVARLSDSFEDLVQTLKDLRIDNETIIILTSDNGPHNEGGQNPQFFRNYGPFDGIKQDIWEGGLREPTIVRWPGKVAAGSTTDHPSQFHDWMATLADLGGVRAPFRCDGVSLSPTLLDKGNQAPSRIYGEYDTRGSDLCATPRYADILPSRRGKPRNQEQMVYVGKYKGARSNIQSHADPFHIYDTLADPGERHDLMNTPEGEKLQQIMHNQVLRMRRTYDYAHEKRRTVVVRPYDEEFVPALTPQETPPRLRPLTAASAQVRLRPYGVRARTLYLQVPEDGRYFFFMRTPARQGAKAFVRLHDMHLLDADFKYAPGSEVSSSMGENTTECDPARTGQKPVLLQKGLHPLHLETVGFSQLPELFWQKEGGAKQKITDADLLASLAP